MESLSQSLTLIVRSCISNALLVFVIIGVLWIIQFLNAAMGYYLNRFGLLPRTLRGLLGIVFCPLLHGSFRHLFLNSMALFILMSLVLVYGVHVFVMVTLIIILLGGILVWVFGRPVLHVGASGLVMGYWGFVLVAAIYQGTMFAIVIGVLCLFYLSSLFINLFPTDRRTSWEGHIFGFMAGVLAVYIITHIKL